MAHDYRLNPFTDTMDSVDITEYQIVPATSPYTIRTAEVPQKTTPSTIVIKEITSFSGNTPVYGRTFTEVSATPSTSQFMPDYYTNAGGDENWNTGLILFNAADAGTMIEVSYKGTGTLASVNEGDWPAWMRDKGTGTSGNYNPTSSTTLAAGTYNFASVTIPAGVTVTCSGKVYIKCTGNFINNGTINANGAGGSGGGSTNGNGNAGSGANGGGNGGAGGSYNFYDVRYYRYGGAGGAAQYNIQDATTITGGAGGGSGAGCYMEDLEPTENRYGGAGGNGGGAVIIVASSCINNGTIRANGNNGGTAWGGNASPRIGGGGGGGGIIIMAAPLVISGTCSVAGGSAGASYPEGGTIISYPVAGGAGRVISALIRS